MPTGPFTITKDFIHGTEDGCIRVTAVPHIIIYRIPRDFAQNLSQEAELKQAGIYLLVNSANRTLYVGQADSRDNGNGILGRMLEPHTKKKEIDQWDVGYALTSGTPTFFGATELNWLEQFFYDEAVKAGKYELLNCNRPHASSVTFSTKTLLGNYTDFAFFLLRLEMGCDIYSTISEERMSRGKSNAKKEALEDPSVKKADAVDNSAVFYIDNESKGVHAEGVLQEDNRLLVRKDSSISEHSNLMNQKRQEKNEIKRQQLIADGVISGRIFTQDYVFTSPSLAASIILGTSVSGNRIWVNKNGVSIGELKK